jgi:hypothetical protein
MDRPGSPVSRLAERRGLRQSATADGRVSCWLVRSACVLHRQAWRLFWLAMLVAHLPACVSALREALLGRADLLRLALLAVAQALFVLKVLDVVWLRVRATPRALLSGVCVIALLHAMILPLTRGCEAVQLDPWYTATALGAASVSISLLPAARRLAQGWNGGGRERWRRLLPHSPDERTEALLPPRFLLLSRACLVARAPPA